jgi:transposase-like protein
MKKLRFKTDREKEIIIAEYLRSRTPYRKLGEKYGIDYTSIHKWVTTYQDQLLKNSKSIPLEPPASQKEILPVDVKQLQEELRKVRLHNELLNSMIDIAEDQLKIDIRKKSGTKR